MTTEKKPVRADARLAPAAPEAVTYRASRFDDQVAAVTIKTDRERTMKVFANRCAKRNCPQRLPIGLRGESMFLYVRLKTNTGCGRLRRRRGGR